MTNPAETGISSRHPEKGSPEPRDLPDVGAEGQRERRATLRWVLIPGVLGASLVAAFNLYFLANVGAWQFLAVAGAMGLALVCMLVAALLARRERMDSAGGWVLLGLACALFVAELLHRGLTLYLVPGGILLILITGYLVLPRRLLLVALLAATFAGYAWLVNRFETWLPFQRYDMQQLGTGGDVFAVFVVGFLLLGGVWGIIRGYRRIVAIRTRLAVSFVLVVLLTATIILAAAIAVLYQNGRERAITQLDSIARIKEVEIERWVRGVDADLDLVLQDSQVMPRVLVLLQNPEMGEAQEYFTRAYLEQVVARTERLETLALLDAKGRVVLSTRMEEKGRNEGAELYFQGGLDDFYLQPPVYSRGAGGVTGSVGEVVIMAARPVMDAEGETVGVLAARVRVSSLAEILGRQSWIGDTGEIYIVDRNGVLLTPLRFSPVLAPGELVDEDHFVVDSEAARLSIARRDGGSLQYTDYRGEMAMGVYHWLPDLQTGLVAKQDRQEAFGFGYLLILVVGLAGLIAIVLAIGISLVVTRTITGPLAQLTARSSRIASGDMSLTATEASAEWWTRRDEIGTLARAFNSMGRQVRELIETLEARVAERTRELERRSTYLEASAEVSRAAGSILNPDELVREVVGLIGQEFDLESTELYLLDERGEWAVLQATAGRGGQAMPGRDLRVQLGEGTIGRAILDARWEVSVDAASFGLGAGDAPLRADEQPLEAALPLRSRGQVLGAIVVRAAGRGVLTEDTMVVLQTMADQVAVALDNAQLFMASQRAMEAERRAHGEVDRQAWAAMIRARPVHGYRCDAGGVLPLPPGPRQGGADQARVEDDRGGRTVSIPLLVREEPIGMLRFHKAGSEAHWTEDELALLARLSEELGQALESVRLYQDVQRGAARDRLIARVTGRMRESLQVDTVLQAAVQEMRRALFLSEVEVRIGKAAASTDEGRAVHRAAGGDGNSTQA
ncbi:MAG TPA: cache domain-containing protein [Anaerolineae bacterium]|nr:cache domain-containing protein [Anaerolineae bacterium]